MVFEENCQSCGKFREIKYCQILKINVCYECCVLCEKRSECNLRVWFKNLVPITTKMATRRKEKALGKYF